MLQKWVLDRENRLWCRVSLTKFEMNFSFLFIILMIFSHPTEVLAAASPTAQGFRRLLELGRICCIQPVLISWLIVIWIVDTTSPNVSIVKEYCTRICLLHVSLEIFENKPHQELSVSCSVKGGSDRKSEVWKRWSIPVTLEGSFSAVSAPVFRDHIGVGKL